MIAVTQTAENVWCISLNGEELEFIEAISSLQQMEKGQIVCKTMALGLVAYANITLMDKEHDLYG